MFKYPGKKNKKLSNWIKKCINIEYPKAKYCLSSIVSGQTYLPTLLAIHMNDKKSMIAIIVFFGPLFLYLCFSIAIILWNFCVKFINNYK